MAKPSIGVFQNLTYAEYDRIDAWRRGHIVDGVNSLAKMRYRRLHPEPATAATLFGAAFHAYLLQPTEFERVACLGPINDTLAGNGRTYGRTSQKFKQFCDENPDKIVLETGDYELMPKMAAAVREHPVAAKLVQHCSDTETTMVWEDRESGIVLKQRLDGFSAGIIDVKTCEDAGEDAFNRSMLAYGYDIQCAMAIDGWRILRGADVAFTFVLVEKGDDNGVATYMVDRSHDWYKIGHMRYRRVLTQLAGALRTGDWPGYPMGSDSKGRPAPLIPTVPTWILKQFGI